MKVKKDLPKFLTVLALVVSYLGILISGVGEPNVNLNLVVPTTSTFFLIITIGFIYSKSDALQKVGYGFISLIAINGIASLFLTSADPDLFGLIVSFLLFIAAIIYFIRAVLHYFGYVKEDGSLSFGKDNSKVVLLKGWKKLRLAEKISEEDYNIIKDEIINKSMSSKSMKKMDELRELLEVDLVDAADIKEALNTIKE